MSCHTKLKKKLKNLSASGQYYKRYTLYDYALLQIEAFKYVTGGAFKLLFVVYQYCQDITVGGYHYE